VEKGEIMGFLIEFIIIGCFFFMSMCV